MTSDKPKNTITELTKQNVDAIAALHRMAVNDRTFGERIADWVAAVVGSWPFILGQTVILFAWMVLNVIAWFGHWDPYPFILLNLVLSFQAAFASPIIMMSQNRQAKVDARRNHLDLQINLLAEQESTETLRLLRLLCKQAGIPADAKPLEQPTCIEELARQIRGAETSIQAATHPAKVHGAVSPTR